MNKLTIIAFFFVSAISFAQSKFIEVEVRDTLMLEPSAFEYVIRIMDFEADTSAVISANDYNPKVLRQKYNQKSDEIKKLLKSKKYNFRDLRDSNYELNSMSFYNENGFIVMLDDIAKLKNLKKELSDSDYVSASVGEVFYDDRGTAEQMLIRRLIEKAQRKAMVIASASDLKLGKILEIKEVKEVDNFSFNIMDTYFVSEKRNRLSTKDGSLKTSVSKAMVIKFSVE